MKRTHLVAVAMVAMLAAGTTAALAFGSDKSELLGSVDTEFKLLGADHKVVVEVFDDPMVQGVSCYVSRAKTGGIKGSLGLAEDTSDASVACRQVDDIKFTGPLPKQGQVFSQSSSPLFKKVRVERLVDARRNALVYLVYSDKLVEGSPKNSVTAVAVPRQMPIPVK